MTVLLVLSILGYLLIGTVTSVVIYAWNPPDNQMAHSEVGIGLVLVIAAWPVIWVVSVIAGIGWLLVRPIQWVGRNLFQRPWWWAVLKLNPAAKGPSVKANQA